MGINFNRKESDIKRGIINYLRMRQHLVIPFRNVGIKKLDGTYIPSQRRGIADIIGAQKNGKLFAVEVKGSGGKISVYQRQFLDEVRSYGCVAIVASSIDDCIKAGL